MHRKRQLRRLVGGGRNGAVGDTRRGFHRLEIPLPVALVELIMLIDPQQLIVQAALRDRRAIGSDVDDIESRTGAVGQRAP